MGLTLGGLEVVLILVAFVTVTSPSRCPSFEFDLDGIRCCRKCLPGSGVVSPCTHNNDTTCAPCQPGNSYSPHHSHEKSCQPCGTCPPHAHVTRPCNVTHDIRCSCNDGYFMDINAGECRPCAHCPVGFGASRACKDIHDTRCRRCPNGTYSDLRAARGCRVCNVCGPGQLMLQQCNTRQNTVCVDLPHSTPQSSPADSDGQTGDPPNSHSDILPLYCALLGLLVAGLFVYVLVKHCHRTSMKNKMKIPLGYSVETPGGIIEQHKPGSDSGVYMEIDAKPVTLEMRVRDIPVMKCRALESYLSGPRDGGGGWRSLARELGYSNSRIASFEVRAEQDGHSPVRYVLGEYGKSSSATVGILIRALRNIGRDDTVAMLLHNVSTSSGNIPQMV